MNRFVEKYRGAAVYVVDIDDPSEGQILNKKVIAKAMLPEPTNMKVDFVKEAATKKEAIKMIRSEIDQYLDKHQLTEFVFDNL